jgi:hypothetical protein
MLAPVGGVAAPPPSNPSGMHDFKGRPAVGWYCEARSPLVRAVAPVLQKNGGHALWRRRCLLRSTFSCPRECGKGAAHQRWMVRASVGAATTVLWICVIGEKVCATTIRGKKFYATTVMWICII